MKLNSDRLIAALTERLPDAAFSVPGKDQSIVSIGSTHPAVGELRILDDGDEYTLCIGEFTHCHFEISDESPSREIAEEDLVGEVVDFVDQLLSDQIEFFGRTTSGGFRPAGGTPRSWLSRLVFGPATYVWSGPVKDD